MNERSMFYTDGAGIAQWAMGWMIGGSSPSMGWEFFSSPPRPDRLWVPTSLLHSGYRWGSFPRGEANHSPSSSVEVKNAWNYTSTPAYVFMAWCFVTYRKRLHVVMLN
jgi:hypothetical protein